MATKADVSGRLPKTKIKNPTEYSLFVAIDNDTTLLVLFDNRTVSKALWHLIDRVDEENYTADAHGNATNTDFPKDLYATIYGTHQTAAEEAANRFNRRMNELHKICIKRHHPSYSFSSIYAFFLGSDIKRN